MEYTGDWYRMLYHLSHFKEFFQLVHTDERDKFLHQTLIMYTKKFPDTYGVLGIPGVSASSIPPAPPAPPPSALLRSIDSISPLLEFTLDSN